MKIGSSMMTKTLAFTVMMFGALSIADQAEASAKKAQAPAVGAYDVDVMHSKVGFEIPHLVISTVEGRFTQMSGEVQVAENFSKSSVNASVDMKSVDTAVKDRDDHLRSADFFDVEKHPKMSFKSTAVQGSPEKFKLVGDLTIKGVTKKVSFDAQYLGSAADAYGNVKAAFKATAKINRKDFGLTWSKMVEVGPVVGDEVTLTLNIQAAQRKK